MESGEGEPLRSAVMWIGQYILDEHGDPQPEPDTFKWAQFMETAERRVAADLDEGDGSGDPAQRIFVSTMFLGLDMSFHGSGPPILWETMVFGGLLDGEQARYTSREAALLGHQSMCERVMATLEKNRPGSTT